MLFGKESATLVVIKHEEFESNVTRRKRVVVQPAPIVFANEDERLMAELRELRKQLADAQAIPAYIVMSDKVLHNIVQAKPTTLDAFGEIPGISDYKKEKYGKDFIAVIKKIKSV